ncbi:hypothetical protein JTE90_003665 [Oedothorax gibbosus]|uniref:NADH dehydrogenase [ubiquinone] 1 beta subcomplex subunit 10 n=1 Tax=Oedothorax gibbosus TaxID=931172 RepID=A0AAV6VT33_9ARAC|nr:hypothetical protein JTE90_003665 [Oedothorax gibbosus]
MALEPKKERNVVDKIQNKIFGWIDGPVTWFRESVVLPNQKPPVYYHRKYPRVPTIDECYEEDGPCMFEANEQFKRDMQVEGKIVDILNRRKLDCYRHEGHERHERCKEIFEQFEEANKNYFIKYGDLGAYAHAKFAYMKQKHRMVYERQKAAGTWNPDNITL